MRIPQDIIDRILQETNIVEVVSESVSLRKAGASYKGLCPFHGEKTPSFIVSPQKQIFHCFGCGEGGSVIQFLMKNKNLDFRSAIETLAARLQITLPTSENQDPKQEQKNRLYKINQYARWYFSEQLKQQTAVQDYLKRRGLNDEVVAKFCLGYALDSFESLTRFLQSKKIPLAEAKELGLIKASPRQDGSYYDFYRDRLIFPIHGTAGRVIGFGGRLLKQDDKAAKYINSPESPIYHKSAELYGFFENKASILQKNTVIVVEGYIDVLACVQLGFDHVVAPLGTSLTAEQVQRFRRYNLEVILMLDGDAAGLRAAHKAVELCFTAGIHPRVAVLPEGRDPGDYLLQDKAELQKALEDAPFAMDWILLETFKQARSLASGQSQALQNIEVWLQKLPPTVSSHPYRVKAGQYFGIPAESDNKFIEKPSRFAMQAEPLATRLTLEEILVLLWLRDPKVFPAKDFLQTCDRFAKTELKDLVLALQVFAKKGETLTDVKAISGLPDSLQKIYARLLAQDDRYEMMDPNECWQRYQQDFKKRRLKDLTLQIADAELQNNTILKMQLLAEKQKIMNNLD